MIVPERDEKLIAELIDVSFMYRDKPISTQDDFKESLYEEMKDTYIEEIYNFLKSTIIRNHKIKGYLRQIVYYNILYMVVKDERLDIGEDFLVLLERFLRDRDFGIELLRRYFLVLSDLSSYLEITDQLSPEDNRACEYYLDEGPCGVESLEDSFRNLIYSLYCSFLNEGYSEEEAIELISIYFMQDGISPVIIDEYMPYHSFLQSKDKFLNLIKSDARNFLGGKIHRTEAQDYVLNALILDFDFEDLSYRREVFRLFIQNLERMFGKPRF